MQYLTSDFPDGLSGITAHNGKRGYSVILTTLRERRGEEASGAHVSWMSIPLDHMLAHILLYMQSVKNLVRINLIMIPGLLFLFTITQIE